MTMEDTDKQEVKCNCFFCQIEAAIKAAENDAPWFILDSQIRETFCNLQ